MKIKKSLLQLSFYSFFGLISLAIDFIMYMLLTEFFNVSASTSKIFSFIAGSVNSFILNKTFTFKVKKFYINQPIKFAILYSISLFFNSITHDFFDNLYDGLLPFGVASFVSVLINFSGQKFWVFKNQ
jgi:putative flippase GtrA